MKRVEKISELRKASVDELKTKIVSMEEELMNLRFRHESGQLEKSSELTTIRRDIARARTVIEELKANQG